MKDEQLISVILAVVGVGLSITALLDTTLRVLGLSALLALGIFLFFTLKIQGITEEILSTKEQGKQTSVLVKRFHETFDVHKKIYKIENELKNMRKGKKGSIDPLWGVAAIAVIVLILFILAAAGVINLT